MLARFAISFKKSQSSDLPVVAKRIKLNHAVLQ